MHRQEIGFHEKPTVGAGWVEDVWQQCRCAEERKGHERPPGIIVFRFLVIWAAHMEPPDDGKDNQGGDVYDGDQTEKVRLCWNHISRYKINFFTDFDSFFTQIDSR